MPKTWIHEEIDFASDMDRLQRPRYTCPDGCRRWEGELGYCFIANISSGLQFNAPGNTGLVEIKFSKHYQVQRPANLSIAKEFFYAPGSNAMIAVMLHRPSLISPVQHNDASQSRQAPWIDPLKHCRPAPLVFPRLMSLKLKIRYILKADPAFSWVYISRVPAGALHSFSLPRTRANPFISISTAAGDWGTFLVS